MEGTERRVSDRSLENLKLGAKARYQGKVRQNVTILPDSLEWLKKGGNVSGRIDQLVEAAKAGELVPNNTHYRNSENRLVSNDVYQQKIETLENEAERLRSQVAKLEADKLALVEKLDQCEQQQEQQVNWQPDLEQQQESFLASLRLGKQAPDYKQAKRWSSRFTAFIQSK